MTSAGHGARPGGRPSQPPRFFFWVDRGSTPGAVLLRYDLRGRGVHRGARLGTDGRWHASAAPDQLMWLGSGAGEAIDADQARAVAADLGHPEADLTDPRVLP